VHRFYSTSDDYDDHLFVAQLLTGFHGLLRLGELVWPDKKELQDHQKVVYRTTAKFATASYSFFLPSHKGDPYFEGNHFLILQTHTPDDPFLAFKSYLTHHDTAWPYNLEPWLHRDGSVPT
jgi:hypothetical protein